MQKIPAKDVTLFITYADVSPHRIPPENVFLCGRIRMYLFNFLFLALRLVVGCAPQQRYMPCFPQPTQDQHMLLPNVSLNVRITW